MEEEKLIIINQLRDYINNIKQLITRLHKENTKYNALEIKTLYQ